MRRIFLRVAIYVKFPYNPGPSLELLSSNHPIVTGSISNVRSVRFYSLDDILLSLSFLINIKVQCIYGNNHSVGVISPSLEDNASIAEYLEIMIRHYPHLFFMRVRIYYITLLLPCFIGKHFG